MAKAASGSSYWIGIAENKNALLQLQDDLKLLKKYTGFEKFGYGLFYIEQARRVDWANAVAACHKKGRNWPSSRMTRSSRRLWKNLPAGPAIGSASSRTRFVQMKNI
ncbi:GM18398 [Drosophila sechellia]|uniref:GM18398 n=1 Tax=Drosophila sechellia TaxID=7238 RepID=B4I2W2_DROSE|nr:GM18398 [Drosophila sechellia]